ncbi:MAG: hypothetical protein QOE36_651 [Gaiellaceae bacterium]|jgi:lipoprotein-anchoring transpeptidase ErfK/SrfK|nr:hypothetical protein [Gaiellaceae bacterium]
MRARLCLVVLAGLAVTGAADARAPAPQRGTLEAARAACAAGALTPVGSTRLAYAAVVRRRAVAFTRPGGRELGRFGSVNANRYPTVLGVLGAVTTRSCAFGWFRVQLPMRPNGVTGYVRASAVQVLPVRTRIEIDLSAHRLTLFRAGRAVLRATVAVGAPATPTPIGRYYVNQRLVPSSGASGPYGPGALGVSAFSNVLTGWAQGGPIGIHGTNEPWSIGRSISNGCIRVPNALLRRLFNASYAGTPVVIHP